MADIHRRRFLLGSAGMAAAVLGEPSLTGCRSVAPSSRSAPDLHYARASAAGIIDGSFDARQVAMQTLERLDSINPRLNAVVAAARDELVTAADELDSNGTRTSLAGVPVTIKDAIDVSGMPTTWGNPDWKNNVAATDAEVVKRLRVEETTNPLFGPTHNPWNTGRVTGGSSGGSAAAVAAGLSCLDIGPVPPAATTLKWALSEPRHNRLRDFRVGVVLDDPDGRTTGPVGAVLSDLIDDLAGRHVAISRGWPQQFDPRASQETFNYMIDAYLAFKFGEARPDSKLSDLIDHDRKRTSLQATVFTTAPAARRSTHRGTHHFDGDRTAQIRRPRCVDRPCIRRRATSIDRACRHCIRRLAGRSEGDSRPARRRHRNHLAELLGEEGIAGYRPPAG